MSGDDAKSTGWPPVRGPCYLPHHALRPPRRRGRRARRLAPPRALRHPGRGSAAVRGAGRRGSGPAPRARLPVDQPRLRGRAAAARRAFPRDRLRPAGLRLLRQAGGRVLLAPRPGKAAGELARALGIRRAAVVGHDMGLTVAVEMLCRHEADELGFAIDRLVLCNGSHLVELAHITQLQKDLMTDEGAAAFAAAFDPERFALGLRFVWGDPTRTPEVDIRAIAYWMAHGGGLGVIGKIARYNLERTRYADRWRPILSRTRVPIGLVWGDRDPIAVLEIGRRLAEMSGGPLTVLEGVGHYPQMEHPAGWAAAVLTRCGTGA